MFDFEEKITTGIDQLTLRKVARNNVRRAIICLQVGWA